MATTVKEAAIGKERRRSPSPSTPIDIPKGRRAPRPPGAGSPGTENSFPLEKPTPNYRKPTASSTNETNKLRKRPTLDAATANSPPFVAVTANSLTRKKSLEKNPSLTRSPSQTQRTPTSTSPRDKPLKPTSSPPKTVISLKPISDKPSKELRNGRVQKPPLKVTKTIKREPSLRKGEAKASPPATSIHDVAETSANLPDKKKDEAVNETTLEIWTIDREEQCISEIEPIDYIDVEPDFIENNKASLIEEHKESAKVEESIKKDDEQKPINNEEHRDGKHPHPVTTVTLEQINVENGEEKNHDGDEVVRTCQGNANREKESETAEKDDSEVRERAVGIINKPKLELEVKKAPRRQHSQEKKEIQAYNDVIEETASKLVEKRKSKVMALVGAFETVISLEESNSQCGQ